METPELEQSTPSDTLNEDYLKSSDTDEGSSEKEHKDYLVRYIDDAKRLGLPLHIHIGVTALASLVCFMIWRFQTSYNIFEREWWFLYPVTSLTGSIYVHYYIHQKRWFSGIVAAAITVNIGCIIAWGFQQDDRRGGPGPFFIWPLFSSTMLLVFVYYLLVARSKYWHLIFHEYWLLNLFLFVAWLFFRHRQFPWFFGPLILTTMLYIWAKMLFLYKEKRFWVYSGVLVVGFGITAFVIWGFTWESWTKFLSIPFVVLCVAEVALYNYEENAAKKRTSNVWRVYKEPIVLQSIDTVNQEELPPNQHFVYNHT